jgi:hypothetical protein
MPAAKSLLVAAQQPDTQVAVPLDLVEAWRAQTVELRPVAAGEMRQAEAPAPAVAATALRVAVE